MKIKLSEWASVAEILGAVAIVISLFFVGFQISDGNNETRAATTQAALDAEMAFQAELLRYADVWEKSVLGGDLTDEVERRRAIALYNMAMTSEDNRYQMGSSGYLKYSGGALRQLVAYLFTRYGGKLLGLPVAHQSSWSSLMTCGIAKLRNDRFPGSGRSECGYWRRAECLLMAESRRSLTSVNGSYGLNSGRSYARFPS